MAELDHAPLAPSSASRIVACPGSARLAAMFPQEETVESREGTAAHWALAELLNGRAVAVGQVADNGVTLTEEMVECAEDTADYIHARDGDRVSFAVEKTLRSAYLHEHNWGTPDYTCRKEGFVLHVDDFKYGHKYVDAVENWQLINYALLELAHDPYDWTIVLTIHQPRCYYRGGPHRSWTVKLSELRAYEDKLRQQFATAMGPNPPCIASNPDECEHCPGRWGCEAATMAAFGAIPHAYAAIPLQMSPAAMGLELRILRRAALQLKAVITGLEEQGTRQLREPGGLPGWDVEHGPGRTIWSETIGADTIIASAAGLGVDISKPGMLTPAQARKVGMHPDLVDAFTVKRPGEAKLVEVDATLVSRIFGRK